MLTIAESGQRDEGRGLGPTVHDLQDLPCDPFSIHAMGTQQLHGFERTETVLRQDRYTVADGDDLDHRMTNTQGPVHQNGLGQASIANPSNENPSRYIIEPSRRTDLNRNGEACSRTL